MFRRFEMKSNFPDEESGVASTTIPVSAAATPPPPAGSPGVANAISAAAAAPGTASTPLPRCYCLCGIGIPLRYFSLCALTLQTTSAVILTRYSKVAANPNEPKYANTSLVVSTEAVKLLASLCLMYFIDAREAVNAAHDDDDDDLAPLQGNKTADAISDPSEKKKSGRSHQRFLMEMWQVWKQHVLGCFQQPLETSKLAIPALLYTVQNNMIYVALSNLEATTFQVGYQSKVITTAILSVIMLGTKISMQRWVALFLLMVGIVLTQVPSSSSSAKAAATSDEDRGSSMLGIGAVLCSAFCSAFAGVYFEKILKGTNPSVWLRNAQLAFFSMFIGLLMYGFDTSVQSFFQGYNLMVLSLIAVQALGGLIIAVVVKYADNILKGFATALSIVLCGVLSSLLMGFEATGMFTIGCLLAIVATVMYSL